MITLDLSILNQKGTPMFNSDIFANRPAAGVVGRIFISTDTKVFYRDTGTTWELVGGSGSGTITGSGTTGTLSKFTSSSSIGDSIVTEGTSLINITGTNSRLAIGGTDDGSSQLQTYFDGNTRWKFVAASNVATDDADITGYRSRGTNASKLAIQSGDAITNYSGRGYDGTNFVGGAGFDVFAAENFSVGSNGTYIAIETTPIGTSTPTYFHRFSADGGLHVGQNSDPTTGFTFQVTGNSNVLGFGAFQSTLTAANNNSSLAAYGVNTLSYAAGFSSNNIGALYGGVAGFNLQTFAGSATFAQANVASGGASVNSIDFSSAGSTITMTQSSGLRAMTGNQVQIQYQGTNSGTITHAAIQQNLGFYRPSGASGTLTITNAYSHLINALDDYGAGFTFTNRWGIYQAGASDKNYFAANMLLGSLVDSGQMLQVNGTSKFTNKLEIGSSSNTSQNAISALNNSSAQATIYSYNYDASGYSIYSAQGLNYFAGDLLIRGTYNPYTFANRGVITLNGTSGNVIGFTNNTIEKSYILSQADQLVLFNVANGSMQFGTNNIEAARISNARNFLVGTSVDSGYKLDINGSTILNGSLTISNNTGLPAQTGSVLRLASGFSSPTIGKMYIGDGTGWRFSMSKRIGSVDTELINFLDNGNLLINQTTDNGQRLQLNGSLRIDGQTSGSSSGSSGQHLIINCDGTTYKIALLNP